MSDGGTRTIQFSLRDLLVLTAVVAVALPLLLAWINDSRTPSRRSGCINHQRTLIVAMQNYEVAHRQLPGRFDRHDERRFPWTVALLPYLEEPFLYDELVSQGFPTSQVPRQPYFVCPSDPRLQSGDPTLSYVVNAGSVDLISSNPANGVFLDYTATGARVRSRDITDGQGHTLALSENLQATTWGSLRPYESVFVWHPTKQPDPIMRINGGNLTQPVWSATARPSARHGWEGDEYVIAGFLDAHTQTLHHTIDYKVYMQLMTSDGLNSDMPEEWRSYEVTDEDWR